MGNPIALFADLVGKPFEYGGRGPDKYDCYGLLIEMNRRNGIVIPDFFSPTKLDEISVLLGEGKQQWERVPHARPGVAVALRVGRHIAHVGYMVDRALMLHAWSQSNGVMLEPLSNWDRKVEGFYRYAPQ